MRRYIYLLFLIFSLALFGQNQGVIDSQITTAINLCENGTFDSNDSTGWTLGSGWSVTSNELQGSSAFGNVTYTLPSDMVESQTYRIIFDITAVSNDGVQVNVGNTLAGSFTTVGSKSIDVVCGSDLDLFQFRDLGGGFTGGIDNVIINAL